tara:strand:+ start:59500 stop:60099 length:600 start_codon:yes stop_codon:yes gene_type:complete
MTANTNTQPTAAPGLDPEDQQVQQLSARLKAVAAEAGFSTLMPYILDNIIAKGLVFDRVRWLDLLQDVDAEEVKLGYTLHIGPAVDYIEAELSRPVANSTPIDGDTVQHLRSICTEAGHAGLADLFEIIVERSASKRLESACRRLTARDIVEYHEDLIDPLADEWMHYLSGLRYPLPANVVLTPMPQHLTTPTPRTDLD